MDGATNSATASAGSNGDASTRHVEDGAAPNGLPTNGGFGKLDPPTDPLVTALLTDLYQITMAYAYWKAGKHNDHAV